VKVAHVVPSARLAKKCDAAGVNVVICEGIEAGGHDSPDEITSMVLIPQVVDAVKVPVIAAGGFADGRGFVAARALGAKGIQMGTRFVATRECAAHPKFKEMILKAEDNSTVLTGRSAKAPVRCIRNPLANQILEMEAKGISSAELFEMIGPGRSRAASVDGEVEQGTVMSGQVAGMIKDIPSVKEVIDRVIAEAEQVAQGLA
jgi:enoyl-[acyl-carrier protein] reductase II